MPFENKNLSAVAKKTGFSKVGKFSFFLCISDFK
jgi:hypothetical protein